MYIIDKNIENEIIVKKSRFITKLYYLDDVEEVQHICYAYIINGKEKAVDDGEPSGTAGRPILNVIQKKNVTNVLVVVIRYFGGIKLGAGGLVRAYTASTSEVFKLVNLIEKTQS